MMMTISLTAQTDQAQTRRPQPPLVTARLLTLSLLLLAAGSVGATDRLDLSCTEQISREVVFGDQGEVHYEERTPEAPQTVRLTLLRPTNAADPTAAQIESNDPDLASSSATWIVERQVESHDGRVRVDLLTNVLSITDNSHPGRASFRRFQCQPIAPATAAD